MPKCVHFFAELKFNGMIKFQLLPSLRHFVNSNSQSLLFLASKGDIIFGKDRWDYMHYTYSWLLSFKGKKQLCKSLKVNFLKKKKKTILKIGFLFFSLNFQRLLRLFPAQDILGFVCLVFVLWLFILFRCIEAFMPDNLIAWVYFLVF